MYKIREYSVDRNLGYLIQQTTKDSTQEILAYFYGISQFFLSEMIRTSKAHYFDKNIVLFYKETPISFRIHIHGSGPGREEPHCTISVKFPTTSEPYDVADLMNSVVESGLQLSEENHSMPAFQMPELKTPKCLKAVKIAQEQKR